MVGAEHRLPPRQHFLEEPHRLDVLAGVGINVGKVTHAVEGVKSDGVELHLPQRQHLFEKLHRPDVLAGGRVAEGQVVDAVEGFGVVGTERGGEGGLGFGEQRDRPIGIAQRELR